MSTRSAGLAELDLRVATVMFVDLIGATTLSAEAGIETCYAIVTGCLRVLDGIARRHGGVVDRPLSDSLLAVFGSLRPTANAPVAAVTAAIEMVAATARYAREVGSPIPLTLRISVNTGPMIAGDVRGPVVREFAVMGDAVNVAARLKDVGEPGEIHVGAETQRAAAGSFEFEALEPLTLRGKQQRVEAFRVVPRRPTRPTFGSEPNLVETPLIGRDAVLRELRTALSPVTTGAVHLVVGDEGMGKSRLVSDLAREFAAAGGTVAACTATQDVTDLSRHAALELLRATGYGDDDAAPPEAAMRVDDAGTADVGAAPGAVDPRMPALSDVLVRALGQQMSALAGRTPVMAVCEDLQWCDTASLAIFAEVARSLAAERVVWVLTSRPDAARIPALRAAFGDAATVHHLGPLAAHDARALVDRIVADRPVSQVARERIELRACGNPGRLILGVLLGGAVETELEREARSVERGREAERRRVTVLFADITGFTRMSEEQPADEVYRVVSGCLAVMQEVAEKHGGAVDKHLGDCILAMFGVPVALEDAPRAALNAAIEMRRRVREYNDAQRLAFRLDVHIGINTGLSVAGDVSGPLLRDFTLMGDAVSIASKLKDIAPSGQIWVGSGTHRMTAGDFAFEPVRLGARESHAVGKAWELRSDRERVYRARFAGGATLFAEYVGRERELGILRGLIGDLASGRGAVAGIIGEAGLGKSRLLAELAASPEGLAVRWAEGRSIAMGRTLRFHPFVDLLRSLCATGDENTADTYAQLENVLVPVLGTETEDVVPYLAVMMGARLPTSVAERLANVRADIMDRMLLRALRTLLIAVARERPLVVCLEDLYWADRASIDILIELIRIVAEHPIVFLYAARPGFPETTGRIEDVAAVELPGECLRRIELRPLDLPATLKLLSTLFPHGALPRSSRERMAERAAGNPLYLEELLRSLIEQHAVEVIGNGLRATAALDTIAVPGTMQEAILARIDYLRPWPKQVLQLAAVVGQRVAEPVLADLVSEPDLLPEAVHHLVDAQLLVAETRGEIRYLTFKHRLIQDVTYESILESRRAELHRRVGEVIARRMQGAPGFHGMLAYHYSMGNDLIRAEEELFLAGADAARAGAPVEALELLEESSRLYLARHPGGGDPVKRLALHKCLAGAYLQRGHMQESTRNFDAALALLGERSPTTRLAIAYEIAKTFALVGWDLYFRNGGAAGRPRATARDLEVIDLMFDRARAQTTADTPRLLLHGFATLRKLRRVDPATVPGSGMMHAGMVGLFSYGGLSFDVSRRFLALADRYADHADPGELFFCRVMTFCHHFLSGDWDDRHEIPLRDVEDAVRRGQLWDVANHMGLEAIKHLGQGRWREADAQITWLEGMADTFAYDLASVYVHAGLAYLHTERRALDAAVKACDAMLDAHDEAIVRLVAFGTKAKAHVLRGDLAAARATLGLATALLMETRTVPWHFVVVARSRLLLAVSEAELAGSSGPGLLIASRRLRRDALWGAARLAWFRPEVWLAVGQIHWLAGRRRRALQWYGRALDEARRLDVRPAVGRAQLEIGRRLLEIEGDPSFRGMTARQLLGEARKSFEQLGLSWDLTRLDLVLSRVGGRSLAAAVA